MKKRLFMFLFGALVATGLVFSCTSLSEVFDAEFGDTDDKSGQDVKDKTPPSLIILSPLSGTEVGGAYQLTGMVADEVSGVDKVRYRVGAGEWGEASVFGNNWVAVVEIAQYGTHTNYVYAVDKAGNISATNSVWVERAAVPSVIILSPENGFVTNVANITVSGTASIDAPYTMTKVEVKLNGGGWVEADGTDNWSRELNLAEGDNIIQVRAVSDNEKVSATTEWYIIYGKAFPSVVIESPEYGFVTNVANITVSGTAGIDAPYSITKVEVKLNGGIWLTASGTENWSRGLYLNTGENSIIVRVTANNGRTAVSSEWYVFYQKSGETIFVSLLGNDNNPGTRTAPVKSIQKAVEIAGDNDYIHVAQGIYTPGNGLNNESASYSNSGAFIDVAGLTILGGWNADFTERNGISELDGESSLKHVIWIDNVANVTIDGFVIRGGLANGSNPHHRGGGIYINKGSGHLIQNTVIINNVAQNGGGIGIYQGVNHTISADIIENTSSGSGEFNGGGGVFLVECVDTVISGNIAGNTAANWGGAIYALYGTGNTISGTITGNTANNSGGGVYIRIATNYAISATLTGNTANNNGGGVYIGRGSSHTISATITDNTASLGGGVCFYDTSPNATHSFNNAVIHGNSEYGAAIVDRNSNPQGIDTINWGTGNTPENINWDEYIYVSVAGNDSNGGFKTLPVKSIQKAVEIAGNFGLSSIRVAQGIYTPGNGLNIESAGYQYSGAFIDVAGLTILGGWNPDFTERNGISELDGNSALKHVIWIDDVANVTIDGFVIRGGFANGSNPHNSGGGIYINGGSGHNIENAVISNNTATGTLAYGGGVYVNGGTSHTISATISGNTATGSSASGGGVYVDSGTSHEISGTITGNTANNWGGGVLVNGGTSHEISGTITSNTAGNGGGVSVYEGTSHTISGTISDNTVNTGGGVWVQAGTDHTISGTITDNTANNNGGGVFVVEGTNHTISGTIAGNTANTGGGVFVGWSTSHTISGTITGNTANTGGGVCFWDNSANDTHTFVSPTISGNSPYGVYRANANSNP